MPAIEFAQGLESFEYNGQNGAPRAHYFSLLLLLPKIPWHYHTTLIISSFLFNDIQEWSDEQEDELSEFMNNTPPKYISKNKGKSCISWTKVKEDRLFAGRTARQLGNKAKDLKISKSRKTWEPANGIRRFLLGGLIVQFIQWLEDWLHGFQGQIVFDLS